jgi:hypothetical protein
MLQHCQQLMAERQQGAASKLAQVAASMCAAVSACGSSDCMAVWQQMHALLAEFQPLRNCVSSSMQQPPGHAVSSSSRDPGPLLAPADAERQRQEASILQQLLQQLRHHAAACASLGLHGNAAAAAHAVMQALQVQMMEGERQTALIVCPVIAHMFLQCVG